MKPAYPYLPDGKEIMYVPADNPYMREAELCHRTLSTDLQHPTGAVVVLNNVIVGKGANQSALKNASLLRLHKKGWCIRRWFGVPSGKKYWLCPGCSSFRYHAEAQAVHDALSRTSSIAGGDLYLYGHWWCCKPCWDAMITSGIARVYLVENATELFM
jgi:deoxycytidylate deaminase